MVLSSAIQQKQEDHHGQSCLHRDQVNTKRFVAVVYAASIPALIFGYYSAIICATVYAPEEVKRSPRTYIRELEIYWFIFMELGAALVGVASLIGSFQNLAPLALLLCCDFQFLMALLSLGIFLKDYSPDDMPWQGLGLVFLGFAGALILIFLTVYISEISPSTIRGALVSIIFLQIAVGQILYHLLNCISSSTTQEIQKWHWLLPLVLPIFHFVVVIAGVLPESPRWLYRQGYKQQAEESLKMMRSSCEVFKEVTAMELSLAEEVELAKKEQENKKSPDVILSYKVLGRSIIAGFGSLVAQQFVGLGMIRHYSYAIFHLTTNPYNSKMIKGNADNITSMVSSSEIPLIISSLALVGTSICTVLVDRFGRRRLLLVSISGIILSLGLLSLVFSIDSSNAGDENRHFWYNTDEERASCMGLLALLALAIYIIFYSLGIGTVPWIINSEIYPGKYRTFCLAMTNVVYWCSKMIVQDLVFDSLGCHLSAAQMLFLLCLFSIIVCLFIYSYIPETKRLKLEDVEKVLQRQEKCIEMDNYHQDDGKPMESAIIQMDSLTAEKAECGLMQAVQFHWTVEAANRETTK